MGEEAWHWDCKACYNGTNNHTCPPPGFPGHKPAPPGLKLKDLEQAKRLGENIGKTQFNLYKFAEMLKETK